MMLNNSRLTYKRVCSALLCWLVVSPISYAQSTDIDTPIIETGINIQGFSGLINVPSAQSIGYGELHLQYNNLTDAAYYGNQNGAVYQSGNVLSLSTSPFPGLEATIRNSGRDWNEGSDLQANIKYQATFIPKEWFSLAAGYQDVGGITNDLDSYFVALSKDWQQWRFTVGTGVRSSTKKGYPERYEGSFYGVQYQPFDWLQLQAEHDGVNYATALRLSSPTSWFAGQGELYGSLIAGDYETGTNPDKTFFQVGFRYNLASGPSHGLDEDHYAKQQLETNYPGWFASEDYAYYVPPPMSFTESQHYDDNLLLSTQIQTQLAAHGFEDVWVGMHDTNLYVRLENSLYNRSAIDGLGVVLGMIAKDLSTHVQWVDVTLSRYNIPTYRVVTERYDLVNFYAGKQLSPKLRSLPPVTRSAVDADWIGGNNQPHFIPRITMSPQLTKFIGTEIGQADMDWALRTNVSVGLWQGGEIITDYDVNIAHSGDFNDGRSLGKYRQRTGLRHAMLRQTLALPYNIYVAGNVGVANTSLLEKHTIGTFQATWQSLNGQHRFHYDYGVFKSRLSLGQDRTIFSAGYRYHYPFLDVSVTAEAGQYWTGDRGYKLGVNRQIGDSVVGVYITRTDVNLQGVRISIPLGTRKSMSAQRYGFQLKAAEQWDQQLATSSYKGTNQIFVKRAFKPTYMQSIEQDYFYHDRLSLSKINAHLPRLREAYQKYVLEK